MARKALAAVSIALLSLGAASAAQAQTSATVVIQAGTPVYQQPAPVRVQYQAPHPRRGMVWVPGYWDWRGHRHVWVAGHFEKVRPGYRYRTPQWEQRDGRWELHRGGWDRDGDGIANRNDRDRDGDGVPNRRDHQPDNPRRY